MIAIRVASASRTRWPLSSPDSFSIPRRSREYRAAQRRHKFPSQRTYFPLNSRAASCPFTSIVELSGSPSTTTMQSRRQYGFVSQDNWRSALPLPLALAWLTLLSSSLSSRTERKRHWVGDGQGNGDRIDASVKRQRVENKGTQSNKEYSQNLIV